MVPALPLPRLRSGDLPGPSPGELVVASGRRAGSRCPLGNPLTLVGRADGCHLRLDDDGVRPFHCALVHGPEGLLVKELQGGTGIQVNGTPAAGRPLRDNDLLAVGPVEFRVRLTPAPGAATGETAAARITARALQRERDALRVQAAAVAAQQAALTEEEARCQQRRLALEQQEKQLADHLEDKRRQLVQLGEQVRQARAELQRERQSHGEHVAAANRDLARRQQQLEESFQDVQARRARLADLGRYLKRRWHRHWAARSQDQRRREEEVARKAERLRREGEAFTQERLRFNAECELARRQIRVGWVELRRAEDESRLLREREEGELRERREQIEQRQAELARAERRLEDERRTWQRLRLHLEKEAEGLENRVRHQRRKLLDREQERLRLANAGPAPESAGEPGGPTEAEAKGVGENASLLPVPADPPPALPDVVELEQRECRMRESEAVVAGRLAALEGLAGDLADQRLHLAEQWHRFLTAGRQWQQDREAAAAELEAVAGQLQVREQALRWREQALANDERDLRRRLEEVLALRHTLEACQARLRLRAAAWEGERERLLIVVQGRERLAGRRLKALGALRRRCLKHRRRELGRLQKVLAVNETLRQEYASLRDQWLRRHTLLEQKERALADKSLALEQYRQEVIGQAADPPAAEKHLERLRRRWEVVSAAAEQALSRQRLAFQRERARSEQRNREVARLAQELAAREAKLAGGRAAWDREKLRVKGTSENLERQVETLQAQSRSYERQLEQLRDEMERVARVLLGEPEAAAVPAVVRAA